MKTRLLKRWRKQAHDKYCVVFKITNHYYVEEREGVCISAPIPTLADAKRLLTERRRSYIVALATIERASRYRKEVQEINKELSIL